MSGRGLSELRLHSFHRQRRTDTQRLKVELERLTQQASDYAFQLERQMKSSDTKLKVLYKSAVQGQSGLTELKTKLRIEQERAPIFVPSQRT